MLHIRIFPNPEDPAENRRKKWQKYIDQQVCTVLKFYWSQGFNQIILDILDRNAPLHRDPIFQTYHSYLAVILDCNASLHRDPTFQINYSF